MSADVWLFGYGSLIWRPDFDWLERRTAFVDGWMRRFWQGSHDHRGTPEAPGRVVTLAPAPGERTGGIAYRIGADVHAAIFDGLDHREKNGYERREVAMVLEDGREVTGLVYYAAAGNFAWLGDAPVAVAAAQIAAAVGPSGANRDYLVQLDAALRELRIADDHVSELSAAVAGIQSIAAGTRSSTCA